jgi:quercetin dioxygenase-like cupin family protein
MIMVAGLVPVLFLSSWAHENAKVTTAAASKFETLPFFPKCATASVQRGDPTKGPAVFLAKMTSGCTIPWHWNTAAESLMVVSGKAKISMKDSGTSSPLAPGDHVYMPGKHVHEFTCVGSCTFFAAVEGVFDIHYADKDGKEIPIDQALAAKPTAKPPAKKK